MGKQNWQYVLFPINILDITFRWRVGPDHLPLWWTPATNQDPGQGQGTANIIQHMAGLSKYAGPGGWNDPDFLVLFV